MSSQEPRVYIVPAHPAKRFWRLLKQTAVVSFEDDCFGIAKGVAFSGLLSLFPVLASTAAILVSIKADAASRTLSRLLFHVAPPGSEELIRTQFTVNGQRPGWLVVVAALLAVLGASGAMMSLMEGFQAAYRLPSGRPFFIQRGVAIILVFFVAVPAIAASFLIVFGRWLERQIFIELGLNAPGGHLTGWPAVFSVGTRYVIAFLCVVFATGLLYYFGTNHTIKFRSVWPGAFLATFLWVLATSAFAWYVKHLANYNVMYGSIAAVIVLQVWMYWLAFIALFGCEFNAERERLRMT